MAWEPGLLVFGQDGFTPSTGVELSIGLVKRIILERFATRYPARYQEVVSHLQRATADYRAFLCADGYLAAGELVHAIGDEERL